MIVEKQLINAFLSRIRNGAVTIQYWDGTTVTYGSGKSGLKISFKSPKAVRAMLKNMTLGFGESYMDGLIEVEGPLDHLGKLVDENRSAFLPLIATKLTHLPSRNTRSRQKNQIQHHYDLGNDFYKLWLDKSMTYSCAYFTSTKVSLEQAQEAKRELLLRKLQLQKGQRMLDIGSGWGSLLIKAAQEYDITGLGVTLSKEQYEHSVAEAKRLGLDKKIKFELANYQDLSERSQQYDRIVSVGMFEHVGHRNQKRYFDLLQKLLVDDGLSVLHCICVPRETLTDPWIDKYIFPGGQIPSINHITKSLASNNFSLIDFENLRIHYAMTLDEWWRRYEKHKDKVIKMYDERFYRMWQLWLASSSAGFRYGDLNLGQFVFTKGLNNNLPLTREHIYK
ncbi:MAG TPA: cyclopropane-fatty-acyl-phospholipid synthase family protein [Candidatus Saccharimonadales bacterium]|nr:cyclopropane-fatty-acyl-phospholipid synthase family protein [Candidatus Saccharimonadales bacterium]